MSLQILISTVNAAFDAQRADILPGHCVVINQVLDLQESSVYSDNSHQFAGLSQVREKGLSRSRNMALRLASADLCLLSDDDVVFPIDLPARVSSAFTQYPDADIITFMAAAPGGAPFKGYSPRSFRHNIRTAGRVSSIEIAFRRARILESGVRFDDRFGLGSQFICGEEYIFLVDALRQGLNVRYVPVAVATHPAESSGRRLNDALVASKGAMLRRVYNSGSLFSLVAFALKKAPEWKRSPFTLFMLMLAGWKAYGKIR